MTALILTTCGLQGPAPSLLPPTDVALRNDPENPANGVDLIFRNAYENGNSVFSGYEVYYKIYDPLDDSPDGAPDLYAADMEKITSYGSSADNNTLSGLGFSRLYFSEYAPGDSNFQHSDSYPSFLLEQSLIEQDFRIRLILNQSLATTYIAESISSDYSFDKTPYFYRWVGTSDSIITDQIMRKGFGPDDFDINDSDMPDTITIDDLGVEDYYVYISFYIMSFGRDVEDIIKPLYSEPVYLGTLKFNCDLKNER